MAAHLTRSDCEVSNEVDGTMMVCCGKTVKWMGMLGVSVRKMKARTMKMETVTLIGKGRWNLMCDLCVQCMKLI
jgi:hypothetical protein